MKWPDLVDAFKKKLPTRNRRVVVRRVAMHSHGNTELSGSGKVITVTIRKDDKREVQEDSLAHEWGHVLEFDAWNPHGEIWGKYHSKAYRLLETLRDEEV